MKKFILTLMLGALFVAGQAQSVKISEGTKSMREGSFNAYGVSLEGVGSKEAIKNWESFIKEYDAKTKKDKKQDLYVSENVQIPSIGKNPVDVYAMFSGDKSDTEVSVWFDTGSGYVNSIDMEQQSEAAEAIVSEFSLKALKESAMNNEEDQKKVAKNLEGDLKKMQKNEDDLRKEISKAQENILKWEKELAQNEDDMAAKKKEIRRQADVVEDATDKAKKF